MFLAETEEQLGVGREKPPEEFAHYCGDNGGTTEGFKHVGDMIKL